MAVTLASKAFTATGSTAGVPMRSGIARVSGTFVGTVVVEVDALGDGTWQAVTDTGGNAISMTVPGIVKVDNGVLCPTRMTCSVFTSGTINAALRGE